MVDHALVADPARWHATSALPRALGLAGLCLGLGLVLGRADVVLIGAALTVSVVLALTGERTRGSPLVATTSPTLAEQGRPLPVQVTVGGLQGAQLGTVLLPRGDDAPHGCARTFAVQGAARGADGGAAGDAGDGRRELQASAHGVGWGRILLSRPDLLVASPDALLAHGPVTGVERTCRVLPGIEVIQPGPLPPRAAGVVGAHRTRRPGEGTDLLGVREFTPGDRVRRIDWRVSARRGTLHVRATAVDADADVVLCLDTRMDLQPDAATWGLPSASGPGTAACRGSSLDLAVRSAVSLAAAYLRHGDRVALIDLARPRTSVRAGSGRRQLLRIRMQASRVEVAHDASRLLLRPSAVPVGAVVVVLSPFLDDAIAELTSALRRRGADVLAVDVLPRQLRAEGSRPHAREALRLQMAERADLLAGLEQRGVAVLAWDPASFGPRLHRIARARSRGRR